MKTDWMMNEKKINTLLHKDFFSGLTEDEKMNLKNQVHQLRELEKHKTTRSTNMKTIFKTVKEWFVVKEKQADSLEYAYSYIKGGLDRFPDPPPPRDSGGKP